MGLESCKSATKITPITLKHAKPIRQTAGFLENSLHKSAIPNIRVVYLKHSLGTQLIYIRKLILTNLLILTSFNILRPTFNLVISCAICNWFSILKRIQKRKAEN